ncbi:hypothetical protein [Fibrobacter intestinalis]|uniref:hypothetical protein n=1 Tax=Fibrobacter sp. NR9 TaxID=1896200 RepID=UPI000BDA3044|nr:hypothetical protein [Fibrobacter sp. NR9]PBC75313.1 hypothetical protein BGW94_3001 [Fibrobacter sp. NR9]
MKYKGIEIREFTSDKCEVFDPPKTMLVWNDVDDEPSKDNVFAFIPNRTFHVIGTDDSFDHCAKIPDVCSELATNIQLAEWLAKGFGIMKRVVSGYVSNGLSFNEEFENRAVSDFILVRKWDDKEWHKPTREYLGLED